MHSMKNKAQRLKVIKSLINMQKISSQEELQSLLNERDYTVTQATLSRDLKELKIAKVPDGSAGYRYVVPTDSLAVDVPETSELPLVGVKSLEISGQIAVVKTRPGYASVVASIIDSGQNAEIMGTLAGDDTVLLILRHGAAAQKVLDTISALIPGIQDKLMYN